ncbi:MAG: hypothetical protein IJ164_04250 [Duodenibacillus sp.]|nr:hypothetical protein [Duodenibacillus sp.]
MIDLPATRRENLKKIRAKSFSTNAELARAIGRANSQVNDMLTGKKSFGAKIARSIEEKLSLSRGYLDEPHELEKVHAPSGKRIPILSFVQAGEPTNSGDNSYDEWLDVSDDVPNEAYALRIRGASMEPEFCEGDIVIVDPTISARAGDYVVARVTNCYENESSIKQYAVTGIDRNGVETFELRPLNPLFPTLSSKDLEIDLLGVVVEKRTRLR